jgi:chemotaxis receptor (MCP) glutamine deamidase CheD
MNFMRDELKDELDEGKRAVAKLVEHLNSMGAANAKITIYLGGAEYLVTVAVVGPTNKTDTMVKPF